MVRASSSLENKDILGGRSLDSESGAYIRIANHYGRFYTQLNGEKARQLARNRQARRNTSAVGDTRIDDHGITAEEVLELTNKVLDPYTVEFASSMSWFSVWKGRVVRYLQRCSGIDD